MSLLDVLQNTKRYSTSSVASVVNVAQKSVKYVNEVKKLGHVKPLQNPGLIVDVKPNTLRVDKQAKDYRLFVTALLSKYPHYEFVAKVKSGQLGIIKYWFKDTKRNVTVIFGYKDMQKELRLSLQTSVRIKEQRFEPTEVKEEYIPKFGIIDGIDLDNLRIVKYTMYKLTKYCTIKPFDTNINYALKEKFDYTNNGMGI